MKPKKVLVEFELEELEGLMHALRWSKSKERLSETGQTNSPIFIGLVFAELKLKNALEDLRFNEILNKM